MLNSTVAMFKRILFFLALSLVQPSSVSIVSPQSGDVLRGTVEIIGNMNVPNFASAELTFSYAAYPDGSWFTIQTFSQPATDPVIAVWDTAKVTDGDYILRLHVLLQDGSSQDAVVCDLKIRNDEPPPTPSPAPDFFSQISTPFSAHTVQPVTAFPTFPSPTPFPPNPVSLTSSLIYSNFARGALLALVLFAFFSLLLRLRKN
jgi:hypothetical protein